MTEYDYKSKAKIETRNDFFYVHWNCDHCGKEACFIEIPKHRVSGGVEEKVGIDDEQREKIDQKKSYFLSTLIRQLMYPIRRHLPFFLQGVTGDVENKVKRKTVSTSEKATLTKKQKEELIDMAWTEASTVKGINAFHGEVRCDECVNK